MAGLPVAFVFVGFHPQILGKILFKRACGMPGVDFRAVQSLAPMVKVLELVGFVATSVSGDQLHGPCPVHQSQSPRSRSFSVNVAKGVCKCHKCGFAGNQLQLWARLKGLTVYEAAVDLCQRSGVQVPWIERW